MSKVSFDYIRDMPTIRIVVTQNCELCDKGLKSLGYLNNLFTIQKVDVEDGYEEFLLRVPVVLYGKKVLDEGILSQSKIVKNFLKYNVLKFLLHMDI
ncbi:hypothetical protein N9U61_02065 [Acidimicrobiaceae bacterium]|nr:hypothetical protein [Acidimicrobiaceae bacterium]